MSGSESGNRSESQLFEIHVDETIDNDREPEENQVSSSCGAQEKNRKRARACECDEKEADVPIKDGCNWYWRTIKHDAIHEN